jgi:hypothetical protein
MSNASRWQDIYMHLKNNGIAVYSPATKTGDCTAPYVVAMDDGTSQYMSFSSTITYYSLMCYVPASAYSTLSPYVEKVRGIMDGLRPMIMPTGQETPAFYDDTFKAHMISIQYRNYKRSNI